MASFTLKGKAIWDENKNTVYVEEDAWGHPWDRKHFHCPQSAILSMSMLGLEMFVPLSSVHVLTIIHVHVHIKFEQFVTAGGQEGGGGSTCPYSCGTKPWPPCVQCTVYCTTLHCTALYCTALYCTALYCTALYCTALHCTALYCTVLHCTVCCCMKLCHSAQH